MARPRKRRAHISSWFGDAVSDNVAAVASVLRKQKIRSDSCVLDQDAGIALWCGREGFVVEEVGYHTGRDVLRLDFDKAEETLAIEAFLRLCHYPTKQRLGGLPEYIFLSSLIRPNDQGEVG